MAVSKRTRYEVMSRDGFACTYCHATDVKLTVDHVVPVALGGSDAPGNLTTACVDCNAGKASVAPETSTVEAVSDDTLRWAAALEQAAKVLESEQAVVDAYKEDFLAHWTGYLPSDWESTLDSLHKAGLPASLLRESVEAALSARGVETSRFRYFAGCAWRRVARLQEVARELLDGAESER